MFGAGRWRPVPGRVIADEVIGLYGRQPGVARFKYIVEHADDAGSTRRVELKQVGPLIRRMIALHAGMAVPLLVHHRTGKVRFDHKDPAINARAERRRRKAESRRDWDAKLRGD